MKWSEDEKARIVKQIVSKPLTDNDLQLLKADLPDRSISQIRDQYRQIIKPQILAYFSISSSSSSPLLTTSTTPVSTPSKKKRVRKEDQSD